MNRIFERILLRILNIFNIKPDVNLNRVATYYLNIRMFGLKGLSTLPILVYGKCVFYNLSGRILFTSPIRRGMLTIGLCDPVRGLDSTSILEILGEMKVGDNVTLRRGVRIQVRPGCNLVFENNAFIGENVTFMCANNITIKCNSRVAHDSLIMDTDFHFTIDTLSRVIKNNTSPVVIGENNWIGAHTVIKKGTRTPKGTIVAGPNAMLCKDYVGIISEYSLIAGSPAKLLRQNIRRIVNIKTENKLTGYFKQSDTDDYLLDNDIDIEKICNPL